MYFSDYFKVRPQVIEKYGAFNISLVADLPLFIDPFLLFNSNKKKYKKLHDNIIRYLRFLKDKSITQQMTPGLINAWYRFPEVKQIWFGFTLTGNNGSGLGRKFAIALHENLSRIFGNFGAEEITKSSHLEKLCLIRDGVGRDNISDFTTNLIREFLLAYTQTFARKHVTPSLCKNVTVNKVRFNYTTETWERGQYYLPWREKDYVLLTPRDTLTKENTWINRTDLIDDFHYIPDAIPNDQLRTQINNYFVKILPRKSSRKEERDAAMRTIMNFPQLIDYYILRKEQNGDKAFDLSTALVSRSKRLYVDQFKELIRLLKRSKFL